MLRLQPETRKALVRTLLALPNIDVEAARAILIQEWPKVLRDSVSLTGPPNVVIANLVDKAARWEAPVGAPEPLALLIQAGKDQVEGSALEEYLMVLLQAVQSGRPPASLGPPSTAQSTQIVPPTPLSQLLIDHIICMVALPFNDRDTFPYDSVLLPALRWTLEQAPYYWQVVRADAQYFAETVADNVAAWMNRADVFIADISDLNPNVMLELGYMYWGVSRTRCSLAVLERAGTAHRLSDLGGLIRFSYPAVTDAHAVTDIAGQLGDQFAKKVDIQQLNARPRAHYLSPLVLQERFGYTRDRAERLADTYLTMEALAAAPPEDVLRRVSGLTPGFVRGLQDDLKQHLSELG